MCLQSVPDSQQQRHMCSSFAAVSCCWCGGRSTAWKPSQATHMQLDLIAHHEQLFDKQVNCRRQVRPNVSNCTAQHSIANMLLKGHTYPYMGMVGEVDWCSIACKHIQAIYSNALYDLELFLIPRNLWICLKNQPSFYLAFCLWHQLEIDDGQIGCGNKASKWVHSNLVWLAIKGDEYEIHPLATLGSGPFMYCKTHNMRLNIS